MRPGRGRGSSIGQAKATRLDWVRMSRVRSHESGSTELGAGSVLKINCKLKMLASQADKIQTNLRAADEDEDEDI